MQECPMVWPSLLRHWKLCQNGNQGMLCIAGAWLKPRRLFLHRKKWAKGSPVFESKEQHKEVKFMQGSCTVVYPKENWQSAGFVKPMPRVILHRTWVAGEQRRMV